MPIIGLTPDIGDGQDIPQDNEVIEEYEIWWEDNFERSVSSGVGEATGRFSDDPKVRYLNPNWHTSFAGTPERPNLGWSAGSSFPPTSQSVSVDDGQVSMFGHWFTVGWGVEGLILPRSFMLVADVTAPDEVGVAVSNREALDLNTTAEHDYLVPIIEVAIDLNPAEPWPAMIAAVVGNQFYSAFCMGDDIRTPDRYHEDIYYSLQGYPRGQPIDWGVGNTVNFDGARFSGANVRVLPALSPVTVALECLENVWAMRANYANNMLPDKMFENMSGTEERSDNIPIMYSGVSVLLNTLPDDVIVLRPNSEPARFSQYRVLVPPVGPYKGANLGARTRPGSPIINASEDLWHGIDFDASDTDWNNYGAKRQLPDIASNIDPWDPDSPIRG